MFNDAFRRVEIDYTNYRGERSTRQIVPVAIHYGANEWHLEHQWLLSAWDVEKQDYRDFAMKDIHSWTPVPEDSTHETQEDQT